MVKAFYRLDPFIRNKISMNAILEMIKINKKF